MVINKYNKNKQAKLTLNQGNIFWVYDGEQFDMIPKHSNIPHLNVEYQIDWKSHDIYDNPNIIGQIHHTESRGVIFHLQEHACGKQLDKEMLQAILKGIDYVENFKK